MFKTIFESGMLTCLQMRPVTMITWLILGMCVTVQPEAVSQDASRPGRVQAPSMGGGGISGRVVAAATKLPIPGAEVRLFRVGLGDSLFTQSDRDGRFMITDLPNGSYRLRVSRRPFLTVEYGELYPGGSGRPIAISNGEKAPDITIQLYRGGVITGHVLDEFGQPVAGAQVRALRVIYAAGDRRTTVAASDLTNDIGEFRLFGLFRGEYYLSADPLSNPPTIPAVNSTPPTGTRASPVAYAPTYYPSAGRLALGTSIQVGGSQEISGIDVSLIALPLARLSGRALLSDGSPMANAIVRLAEALPLTSDLASTRSGSDGSFELNGIPPEQYLLFTTMKTLTGETEIASLEVDVAGSDLTGLRLQSRANGTVRGRLIVEGRTQPAFEGVEMQAVPRGVGIRIPLSPFTKVDRDGSFVMKSPPGLMWVNPIKIPPNFVLKAILQNGRDITDAGLEIRSSEDISDVQFVLTDQISRVHGTVRDRQGNPVKDNYYVFVFSSDPDRWSVEQRYRGIGRIDSTGRFEIRGLPSGRYVAIALDNFAPQEDYTPDLFERLQRLSTTSLEISAGADIPIELKLQTLLKY